MDQIDVFKTDIEGEITDIKPNFYGKKIAISSSSGNVYIYQINQDKLEFSNEFKAHLGAVFKIGWSNPKFGQMLITTGFDRSVKIFTENHQGNFDLMYEYNEYTNLVNSLTISLDSNTFIFISGSLDGNIVIHEYKNQNIENTKLYAHDFGVSSIDFFKNNNQQFITSGFDNLVKIWKFSNNLNTYKNILTIKDLDTITRSVSCKVNDFITCGDDGILYYWKKNGESTWEKKEIYSHNSSLVKCEFNEEGNVICCVGNDGVEKLIKDKEI